MFMVQILASILTANALLLPLVLAGDDYNWPKILNEAKLLGFPADCFNQEQSSSHLRIVNIADLTKKQVDDIETYIHTYFKDGRQDRRDLEISAPHIGQFSIGALYPYLGVKDNPLIYNYINLNTKGLSNEWVSEGSEEAYIENPEVLQSLKLTTVEYRDENKKRKIMYINPFSRELLYQMKNNNQIRKLEARLINELTSKNHEAWYNFSKNGKIPWYNIDPQLWFKHDLDKRIYPFIDLAGIQSDRYIHLMNVQKHEDKKSFDLQKDADKIITDFDDWMSNQASSSHS